MLIIAVLPATPLVVSTQARGGSGVAPVSQLSGCRAFRSPAGLARLLWSRLAGQSWTRRLGPETWGDRDQCEASSQLVTTTTVTQQQHQQHHTKVSTFIPQSILNSSKKWSVCRKRLFKDFVKDSSLVCSLGVWIPFGFLVEILGD